MPGVPEGTEQEVSFGQKYDGIMDFGINQMIFNGSYFVGLAASKALIELSEKNEITHLVVDLEKNRGEVLIEIYNNEKQFPFLDKIFDSDQYEFDYKMKVFKIDYEKFDKLN